MKGKQATAKQATALLLLLLPLSYGVHAVNTRIAVATGGGTLVAGGIAAAIIYSQARPETAQGPKLDVRGSGNQTFDEFLNSHVDFVEQTIDVERKTHAKTIVSDVVTDEGVDELHMKFEKFTEQQLRLENVDMVVKITFVDPKNASNVHPIYTRCKGNKGKMENFQTVPHHRGRELSRELWEREAAIGAGVALTVACWGGCSFISGGMNWFHFSGNGVGCFPSGAQVTCLDENELKIKKMIQNVKVGDRCMDGNGNFPEVYLVPHAEGGQSGDFVEATTASGHTVAATPYHYISTEEGMKMASQLRPGMALRVMFANGTSDFSAIAKVRDITAKGLFNPLTMTGTLVVNGVVWSVWSEWFLEFFGLNNGLVVDVYQTLMWPVRMLYHKAPELVKRVSKKFAGGKSMHLLSVKEIATGVYESL